MKILLAGLNSQYIHSNLALYYLKSSCRNGVPGVRVDIHEYTINDGLDLIKGQLFEQKPDIMALSCYIWNIEQVLEIVTDLKKVMKQTVFVLGGPEVSYETSRLMAEVPAIDFVIRGEGEVAFPLLVEYICTRQGDINDISGLVYRKGDGIIDRGMARSVDLTKDVPEFLDDYIDNLDSRILYYESSRGCPFNCSYCLSSLTQGVKYFPLDRVKEDLDLMIERGVKRVKFVDRTFNCHAQRFKSIVEHIINRGGQTSFHFEMAAHLLEDDAIELLKTAPVGMFQFEIGIQSTKSKTLKAINRTTDLLKIEDRVKRVKQTGKVRQYLDLIAGLPWEDYRRFKESFNFTYNLKPDKVHLGFLKLLKGSGLREEAFRHGYVFSQKPPYQVIENNYISYAEILRLKKVEDMVDKFYNSGRFNYVLDFIIQRYFTQPFEFFERLSDFWYGQGYQLKNHSQYTLYHLLMEFYRRCINQDVELFQDMVLFQYFLYYRMEGNIPGLKQDYSVDKETFNMILKETGLDRRRYSDGKLMSMKQLKKHITIKVFSHDISAVLKDIKSSPVKRKLYIIFDYSKKHPITKEACFIFHNSTKGKGNNK
ncbi:MAG TPA: B12-binding domain-containing radical SAM protein [Clostridiales bacterium]|nr:B12-binding domain-containing radical SAM protein [Clostridiales bacterium]